MSVPVSSARDTTYRLAAIKRNTVTEMTISPVRTDMARRFYRRARTAGRARGHHPRDPHGTVPVVASATSDAVIAHDMDRLETTLLRSDSAVVLHAAGRVDSRTVAQLQEPLLRAAEAPSGGVAVDAAECPT